MCSLDNFIEAIGTQPEDILPKDKPSVSWCTLTVVVQDDLFSPEAAFVLWLSTCFHMIV